MKQLYLSILFFSINCFSQDEFITVWETTPSDTSITFSTPVNDSPYSYIWQRVDENFTELTQYSAETIVPINNGNLTIQFPEDGFYRLLITSNASQFHIKMNSLKLLRIEQWGNINWSSFENSFSGSSNLDITAYDIPNLSNVTDLSNMFRGCSNLIFNSSISNWNVSTVTKFEGMFSSASSFNQEIQNWNTSNAINLKNMFAEANSFNQYIGDWDVSNAINFSGMFHFNVAFNQPLKSWETDSAIYLEHMFCGATQFNQELNHFNVTQVTDFLCFLSNATNFNQELSNWKLNSIEQGISFLSNSGIDCVNFTNTLLGWSNTINLPENITIGTHEMEYNNSLTPTLDWFTNTKNWIFDGISNDPTNCTVSRLDFEKTNIKIHPNPTSNFINIEGIEVIKVTIYDTKGSPVQKNLNSNQIEISHLSSGNYILIINDIFKEIIIKK